MPDLYIIGGPNGAGKTTAAFKLLPEIFKAVEFINADEIARGISPFNIQGIRSRCFLYGCQARKWQFHEWLTE